jgi:protein-tyrosine phosphatase
VVSLLEPEEVAELGLQDEARLCRENTIAFVSFPIPDRGVPPSWQAASDLARLLALQAGEGRTVAVHCRAGIGRSPVIAACALVQLGMNPDRAFEAIAKARGVAVPDTEHQREWVRTFADWLRSGGPAS